MFHSIIRQGARAVTSQDDWWVTQNLGPLLPPACSSSYSNNTFNIQTNIWHVPKHLNRNPKKLEILFWYSLKNSQFIRAMRVWFCKNSTLVKILIFTIFTEWTWFSSLTCSYSLRSQKIPNWISSDFNASFGTFSWIEVQIAIATLQVIFHEEEIPL